MTKYHFQKTFIFRDKKTIDFDALESMLYHAEKTVFDRHGNPRAVLLPDIILNISDNKLEVKLDLELSISPLSPLVKIEKEIAEEIANEFFKQLKERFKLE